MKLIRTIYAFFLMVMGLRIFRPRKVFKGQRVAIVGAADSLFEQMNGNYIDDFDIVIRINKAAIVWDESDRSYTGQKFTYLFHSFYENNYSGGGPIEFEKFKTLGIEKLVHPNSNAKGLKVHLNFYKRHLRLQKTYIFSRSLYLEIVGKLSGFQPTIGFSAIYSVLNSECREVFLTGFTFFRTPYLKGYRDELIDRKVNKEHIKNQGIHNPDVEFEVFQDLLKNSKAKKVKLDLSLQKLMQ